MEKFNIIKNILLERHSWREYEKQKISDQDIDEIIEVARHAPSSFGTEPWHVIVVSNEKVKAELFPYIWSQKQVLNASHVFLILTNKADVFIKNSEFLKLRYKTRYNNDEETFERLQKNLLNFIDKTVTNIEEWTKRQSYILLENIIICAYAKGIGTSPMEGFDGKDIINYLESNNYIPKNKFNISVVVAAGYIPKDKDILHKSKFLTSEQLITKIK